MSDEEDASDMQLYRAEELLFDLSDLLDELAAGGCSCGGDKLVQLIDRLESYFRVG